MHERHHTQVNIGASLSQPWIVDGNIEHTRPGHDMLSSDCKTLFQLIPVHRTEARFEFVQQDHNHKPNPGIWFNRNPQYSLVGKDDKDLTIANLTVDWQLFSASLTFGKGEIVGSLSRDPGGGL